MRVLVVEDDPVQAMVLSRVLSQRQLDVTVVSNGVEALKTHSATPFGLVISDWIMPEMSGIELCARLRHESKSYVYFMIHSARTEKEHRKAAFNAGVDDFLNKPVNADELYSRIQVAERILRMQADLADQAALQSILNERLLFASKRFEELFKGLPLASFTMATEGTIIEWNDQAERVFGIAGHATLEQPVWEIFPDQANWAPEAVHQAFERGDPFRFEWVSGETSLITHVMMNAGRDGKPTGAICTSTDITELRKQEETIRAQYQQIRHYADRLASQKNEVDKLNEKLSHLAITDGLTGLWNHRRFQESLDEEIHRSEVTGIPCSLILADIDFFKRLNDEYGHQTGDEVLRQFAAILKASSRRTELPARYGGEEFAMVLPGCSEDGADHSAERFRAAIENNAWKPRAVTCSLGVTTWAPGKTAAQLIHEADTALYASKSQGRNQVTVYSSLALKRAA